MTDDQRSDFHDAIRNILFGLRDLPNGDLVQAEMVVAHPELAVALTSRYRCSVNPRTGTAVDPDRCDGRMRPKLPEGPDGRQALIDGLGSVFEERPLVERIQEVEWRVASARRRLIREAYLTLTGETSFSPGSDAKEKQYEGKTVSFTSEQVENWQQLGVRVTERMDVQEFAATVQRVNSGLSAFSFPITMAPGIDNILSVVQQDPWGAARLKELDEIEGIMEDNGFSDPAEYPPDVQAAVQEMFGTMIARGLLGDGGAEAYNTIFAGKWGPLDWEPRLPGNLGEIEPERVYSIDPSDLFVIDGDTVDAMTFDGSVRFRLIGINAPDDPMPGFGEAKVDLFDLLKTEGYSDIKLVVWEPEFFGVTAGTDFKTGQERLKAWLFVNGQPIYHASTFTFRNPTGRGTGTSFQQLPRPTGEEAG